MAAPKRHPEAFDPIEEAGLQSFPASDPPSWVGRRPEREPGPESRQSLVVAGVFDSEDAAAAAFEMLVEAHFEPLSEISIIAVHRRQHEKVPITERFEVDRGARIVGGVGATLGAAGAILVSLGVLAPPLGLLAAGPVVAAMEGAYAGGAVGAVTGAPAGLGIWHDEAEFYATHIHDGAWWVGVHAGGKRAEEARRIFADAGARHLQG